MALRTMTPSFFTTGIFFFLYGVYSGLIFDEKFPVILISFVLIHLGADCFDDFFSYNRDLKNNRVEKLTVSKILSPRQFFYAGLFFYLIGLVLIFIISNLRDNFIIFYYGIFCAAAAFFYSSPPLALRRYPLAAYPLLSFAIYALMPYVLNAFYERAYSDLDLIFSILIFT